MNKFQSGDRVCFVGDSITHKGMFIKQILAYYRKYLPEVKVEFYDCGIAGGNLGNTIKVFDEDIAIYDPTHIVLMIGVNDSRFNHLQDPANERYDFLLNTYEKYQANIETFYKMTSERGIKLTLCTPVPYAEYSDFDTPTVRGAYALIMGYANFIRAFALEKGLDLCDYHSAMTKAMQTEVLYATDRVHPTEEGHFVMARAFLAAQGLELSEPMEYSADLEEWYETTQKIRNIITAEFFVVPNYTECTDEERIEAVKKRFEEAQKGINDPGEYIRTVMQRHINYKPHQKELIEFVKNYMKK